MKLGSEPEVQHRSVESIPTKTASRKKRAKDTRARDIPDDSTDDDLPREAAEMTVKSKSAILNESAIAGTIKRKKKKKKRDVLPAKGDFKPIFLTTFHFKLKKLLLKATTTTRKLKITWNRRKQRAVKRLFLQNLRLKNLRANRSQRKKLKNLLQKSLRKSPLRHPHLQNRKNRPQKAKEKQHLMQQQHPKQLPVRVTRKLRVIEISTSFSGKCASVRKSSRKN